MEFTSFKQFNEQFGAGKFNPAENETVTIKGVDFHILTSSTNKWADVMEGIPGIVVYSSGKQNKDAAIAAGMDEWLALVWKNKNTTIVPVEVHPTTAARMSYQLTGVNENAEPNTIGDIVRVKITNLPASKELKGKVDTGATISSLHAERWKLDGDNVRFVCPELSPNVISVPLVDQQAVKSADGGTEYRPVVELNVKINDKMIQGVQFNLNDRGQMEFPILVGQNILEKGKFLIDPTINESVKEEDDVDWNALYEAIGDIEVPEEPSREEEIEKVYEVLRSSNVDFSDLIRHMRTAITESLDDIEY